MSPAQARSGRHGRPAAGGAARGRQADADAGRRGRGRGVPRRPCRAGRRAGPAPVGAQRARARAAAPDRDRPARGPPTEAARPRCTGRGEPIRFTSAILPAYLRRTRNLEELLPWLYLKGVSTGQFGEALAALLGPDAPGLSASTVRRLTESWQEEHERWQQRDLAARRYVYLWADGVYFTPRLEHERQCLLVLIGADAPWPEGAPGDRGRLSRERPELARTAAPAARRERPDPRSRARHRRRGARLLAGAAPGLAQDPAAAMLGPQDRQRLERPAQVGARQGQAGSAHDLRGREPGGCREGLRSLPCEIRRQVRQGGGLPGQGP